MAAPVAPDGDARFFVPMAVDTDGPAFGTYDDFTELESGGIHGAGLEQGILHRVCSFDIDLRSREYDAICQLGLAALANSGRRQVTGVRR